MFDSVREELQTKITSGRLTPRPDVKQEIPEELVSTPMVAKPIQPPRPAPSIPSPIVSRTAAAVAVARPQTSQAVAVAPQPVRRVETSDLVAPKTSPTLVGFQSKNATLPDWRIQLQNAVQQRKGGQVEASANGQASLNAEVTERPAPVLKAQVAKRTEPNTVEPKISDPRVANALKRINESRNTFLETEKKTIAPKPMPAAPRPYKFDVVPTNVAPSMQASMPAKPNQAPKPRLVSSPTPLKRDTNKLPPLAVRPLDQPLMEVRDEIVIEQPVAVEMPVEFAEIKRIRIRAEHREIDNYELPEVEGDDIEDLALFSTRFGAGLFDLIIASFASLLILSPLAFTRGDWFTAAGLLTFAGVSAIVMFLYMTICLGFYGKTMGMRLFSLELVDAVENEYPTLHQAAVSSSVFILSLVFAGAGFLTVFFNEEKRAAHDLLSGTILVREF